MDADAVVACAQNRVQAIDPADGLSLIHISVQYEPVELIKLFIVLFMAAYLAENSDVIAAAKPLSLRQNARYLGPLLLGWGASMAILFFERDIGMAALLLATFVAMLYVATRRLDLIAGGAVVFALAMLWAIRHYPYVAARVEAWRDPFKDVYKRQGV